MNPDASSLPLKTIAQTMPGFCNVIDGIDNLKYSERLAVGGKYIHQRHQDTYRNLLRRYLEYNKAHVVDLNACGLASAVACVLEDQKYIGFQPDSEQYAVALARVHQVACMKQNAPKKLYDDDRLPVFDVPSMISPPEVDDKLAALEGKDAVKQARARANVLHYTIRKSTIPGAGFGAFATSKIRKGSFLGHYWGKVVIAAAVPESVGGDRWITLNKYDEVDGVVRYVHILGSKVCETSYLNDPAGTNMLSNTIFEEVGFKSAGLVNGLTDPPLYALVRLVATRDIQEGEEMFVDYGSRYCL